MKKEEPFPQLRFSNVFTSLTMLAFLFSCGKDETALPDTPDPITVSINDADFSIAENPTNGTEIGSITASTSEGSVTLTIDTQTPSGAMELDGNMLKVKDASLFDFEKNEKMTASIKAINGDVAETATVTITITDVSITFANATFEIFENPEEGYILGKLSTAATAGIPVLSIKSQVPEGAMKLDEDGTLAVLDANAFDYEKRTSLTAVIQSASAGELKEATMTINLKDVTVTLEDAIFSIHENPEVGDVIGIIDLQGQESITLSIKSQSVDGALKLQGNQIQVASIDNNEFDYESNASVSVVITASGIEGSVDADVMVDLVDIAEYKFFSQIPALSSYDFNYGIASFSDVTAGYSITTSNRIVIKSFGFQNNTKIPWNYEFQIWEVNTEIKIYSTDFQYNGDDNLKYFELSDKIVLEPGEYIISVFSLQPPGLTSSTGTLIDFYLNPDIGALMTEDGIAMGDRSHFVQYSNSNTFPSVIDEDHFAYDNFLGYIDFEYYIKPD